MIKELELNTEVNDFQNNITQPKFQLITGGKGPTDIDGWLKDLHPGTVFLSRRKNSKELMLDNYMVVRHATQSTQLRMAIPDGRIVELWVPTVEFSRASDLFEVLAEMELVFEEEKKEEDNALDSPAPSQDGAEGGSTA